MRSDGASNLLNLGMSVVLIVLGFIHEPLLGVLGALIVVTMVASQLVEELRRKKQAKLEREWRALYGESIPYISPSMAK